VDLAALGLREQVAQELPRTTAEIEDAAAVELAFGLKADQRPFCRSAQLVEAGQRVVLVDNPDAACQVGRGKRWR
jgi:hypothetical protein